MIDFNERWELKEVYELGKIKFQIVSKKGEIIVENISTRENAQFIVDACQLLRRVIKETI